jgi:hypothetical protein
MTIKDSELDLLSEEFLNIPMGTVRSLRVGYIFVTVDCRKFPPIITVDGKELDFEYILQKIQDPKGFLRSIILEGNKN